MGVTAEDRVVENRVMNKTLPDLPSVPCSSCTDVASVRSVEAFAHFYAASAQSSPAGLSLTRNKVAKCSVARRILLNLGADKATPEPEWLFTP